jgi:hypothetical protein
MTGDILLTSGLLVIAAAFGLAALLGAFDRGRP